MNKQDWGLTALTRTMSGIWHKKTRHYNPRRLGFLTHPAIFETPFRVFFESTAGKSLSRTPWWSLSSHISCRRSGSTRGSRTESRWSHWISSRWLVGPRDEPPSGRRRRHVLCKSPSDLVMDRSWWVPQFKTDRDHFETGNTTARQFFCRGMTVHKNGLFTNYVKTSQEKGCA